MNGSDELQHVLNHLSLRFAQISLRGQGQARFVFAQHNGRAVEISVSDGKWWLEFWDVDPDMDAAPVKELTLQTFQEAVQVTTDWLAWGPGQAVLTDTQREAPHE